MPIAILAGIGLAFYLIGLVMVRGPDSMLVSALYVSLGASAVAFLVGYLHPELRMLSTTVLLMPMTIPVVFLFVRSFDLYEGWAAVGQAMTWLCLFGLTALAAYMTSGAGGWLRKRLTYRFGHNRRIMPTGHLADRYY